MWRNFTRAVESLKFCILMGSFRPNHIKFLLKDREELSLMTPKSDEKLKSKIFYFNEKFKEKMTRSFKYDMTNLVNFHPITLKISF